MHRGADGSAIVVVGPRSCALARLQLFDSRAAPARRITCSHPFFSSSDPPRSPNVPYDGVAPMACITCVPRRQRDTRRRVPCRIEAVCAFRRQDPGAFPQLHVGLCLYRQRWQQPASTLTAPAPPRPSREPPIERAARPGLPRSQRGALQTLTSGAERAACSPTV